MAREIVTGNVMIDTAAAEGIVNLDVTVATVVTAEIAETAGVVVVTDMIAALDTMTAGEAAAVIRIQMLTPSP